MASDLISLADALEFVVDNRGKTVPTEDSGIALIATNCVSNDNLYPEHINVRYVSNEIYNNWFRSHPKPNDILLTNKGSKNGAICLVPDPVNFCIAQDMVALRADESKIDPAYLFAALRSQSIQSQIKQLNVDSVIPHFKKTDFDKLYIPLLSKDIQQQIGEIYLTFSKKIELNRQMNETLEAMAQALFKSWFVDFDPVIDNALAAGNAIPDELLECAEQRKGIEKKENSDIQDLFPNEFEFTEEMGWIPKGWEVTTLESLAVISSSKRIFAKEYKTEGIPFFRGKEISLLSKGESFIQDIFISKERFHELKKGFGAPTSGDLLLTSVGTIGNVYLVQEGDEFYFKDGNLTWFSKYKTEIKGAYLSTWFSTRQAYLAIENIKIGSTQQAITISSLNGIEIVQPKDKIVSLFNEFSENIVEKTSILIKERRTLAKLRDTLLPKLMSGELRIADATSMLEDA